jgi:hypothetical protein
LGDVVAHLACGSKVLVQMSGRQRERESGPYYHQAAVSQDHTHCCTGSAVSCSVMKLAAGGIVKHVAGLAALCCVVAGAPVRMYGMDCILDDAALKSGSEPQELAARKEAWDAVKDDIAARWRDMFDGSNKRAKKTKRPAAAAAAAVGLLRGGGSGRGMGTGRAQQQRAEPVQLQEGDRHLLSGLRHPAAAAAAAGAPPTAAAALQPRQRSSRRRGRSAPQQQQRPAAAQQRAAAAGRVAGVGGAAGHTMNFARQGPSTAQGQPRALRQTAIDALFR